jgi:hypothetical protein
MATYTFKLLKYHKDFPKHWKTMLGEVVEIEYPMVQYDELKEKYVPKYLERYLDATPSFTFDKNIAPDGRFMERMSRIQSSYPGAKDMFKDARWAPKREW